MYIPCCTYHVVGQGMKQTWRRLYGYRITSQKGGSEDELRKRKTFLRLSINIRLEVVESALIITLCVVC